MVAEDQNRNEQDITIPPRLFEYKLNKGSDVYLLGAGNECRRWVNRELLSKAVILGVGGVNQMHQVIYALVEASSADEALANGKAAFDRLVGTGSEAVFDYYVTFDDDQSSMAGKARWGELPVVAPVDSEAGANLLKRGWTATKREFERNLDRVRDAVTKFSADELMHDKNLARHTCYNLGAYRGPPLYLYTEFSDAIRHREHLDRVLDTDEQLWIVPADVHY